MKQWELDGRPNPPPHLMKQSVLKEYAERYSLQTLVETGTYIGDMVYAMRPYFEQIYSIELSRELYEESRIRFRSAANVRLIKGDSVTALRHLMNALTRPSLFWLDGHYSGGSTARGTSDTPIYEELSQILSFDEHQNVIIIDDARCFGTDPCYPHLEDLERFVFERRSDLSISVQNDSIRLTPKNA
jgi:hypothetical protein